MMSLLLIVRSTLSKEHGSLDYPYKNYLQERSDFFRRWVQCNPSLQTVFVDVRSRGGYATHLQKCFFLPFPKNCFHSNIYRLHPKLIFFKKCNVSVPLHDSTIVKNKYAKSISNNYCIVLNKLHVHGTMEKAIRHFTKQRANTNFGCLDNAFASPARLHLTGQSAIGKSDRGRLQATSSNF